MAVLVGVLVVGAILLVAAFFVGREATRLAQDPPPPTFSMDEAYEWVVAHVPDDVAATLTPEDVKRILGFQMEFFKQKGAAVNGEKPVMRAPVVVGGAETVAYILDRAAATGEAYLPEQVYAVIETQMSYLRAIGAIGPPADPEAAAPPED